MDKQNFSRHLGFSNWDGLVTASECLATGEDCSWYIVKTNTWYKWVVWNTNFDAYLNLKSKELATAKAELLFAAVPSSIH